MGMEIGGTSEYNSEINVTPMVDVMLVLLIIFMIVTPLLQQGVTINLPKDMNTPVEDPEITKDTSVVIAIPDNTNFYIGKDPLPLTDLGEKTLVAAAPTHVAGVRECLVDLAEPADFAAVGRVFGAVADRLTSPENAAVSDIRV